MGLGTESWSEDWDASTAERHEVLTEPGRGTNEQSTLIQGSPELSNLTRHSRVLYIANHEQWQLLAAVGET